MSADVPHLDCVLLSRAGIAQSVELLPDMRKIPVLNPTSARLQGHLRKIHLPAMGVTYMHLSTLSLKPRGDITRDISSPTKRTYVLQTFKVKIIA